MCMVVSRYGQVLHTSHTSNDTAVTQHLFGNEFSWPAIKITGVREAVITDI